LLSCPWPKKIRKPKTHPEGSVQKLACQKYNIKKHNATKLDADGLARHEVAIIKLWIKLVMRLSMSEFQTNTPKKTAHLIQAWDGQSKWNMHWLGLAIKEDMPRRL
jgi:hypothetical protein